MNKAVLMSLQGGRRMLVAVLIVGLCVPVLLHAHPHAWIDLSVELHMDEQRQLSGLTQTWVFDPVYTLILLEELDEEHPEDARAEQLRGMAARMITSMGDYDYLTRIEVDEERLRATEVTNVEAQLTAGEQLQFRFTLQLPEQVDARGSSVSYMIYDPVYYIEMLHPSADAVRLNGATDACQVTIDEPKPDPSQIARAAAVDLGAASADGLGRHFAQRVNLQCR